MITTIVRWTASVPGCSGMTVDPDEVPLAVGPGADVDVPGSDVVGALGVADEGTGATGEAVLWGGAGVGGEPSGPGSVHPVSTHITAAAATIAKSFIATPPHRLWPG